MLEQPIHSRSEHAWRSAVSRLTLLVVTIALAYGSYRCIAFSIRAYREADSQELPPRSQQQRRMVGGGLPMVIGVGLGGLALITAAGAIMPWRFFERFARPPTSTGQRIAAPRDYFKV